MSSEQQSTLRGADAEPTTIDRLAGAVVGVDQSMVRTALDRHLFDQARSGAIGGTAAALLAGLGLRGQVPDNALLIWVVLALGGGLSRLGLALRARGQRDGSPELLASARANVIANLLSAAIWGAGGLLLWPRESPAHQLILPLCLVAMSAAGATAYSAVLPAALGWVLLTLLPLTARFVAEGSSAHTTMAALTLVYVAFLVRTARSGHRGRAEAIRSRLRYQILASREHQTAARLAAVVNNLSEAVVGFDASARPRTTNPAFRNMFRAASRAPTQTLVEMLPHELMTTVERCLRDQSVQQAEIPLPDERTAITTTSPITDDEGGVLGCVALVRDVTLEREIDRMKTDFTSVVAHELRTPMTSVLGFAKLVASKLDKAILPHVPEDDAKARRAADTVRKNVGIIVEEGQRLTDLINDVLDIAKMESGRMEWHDNSVDAAELVRRAAAATDSLFSESNVTLKVELEEPLPTLRGDFGRLLQVVINLISHAVKFTDQGSVTIQARRKGEGVEVRVIDTGIGIPPEARGKVFERFEQVADTSAGRPRGTGLGLSICREIITAHGGELTLDSAVGVGSTFAFYLPAQTVSHPPTRPPAA